MPSSSSPARVLAAPFLSAALVLSACGSTEPDTLSCETDAECPILSRCISRGCVANSPPVAAIALPPGELQAHVLHVLEGSASDPDAGDSVASFGWTFRAVDAPCEPPVVAGTGPSAVVRFACPGRYEVELTAVDAMGAAGTNAVEIAVAPYAGPALVVAGTDVALNHACTVSPLRCAPVSAVSLSASAPDFPPGEVSFEWTAEPPAGLPFDGSRRVTFQPGSGVDAPGVVIETDGTAISGDWVFHVVARDAAGVIGSAATRVSVLNRPPVVGGAAPSEVHHLFVTDAQGARFTASGELGVSVMDPDGDPLVQRTVQWHHVGDGPGAIFEGVDQQAKLTFSIVVPYADPSDASRLIGGAGLERFVELGISDVNGARTSRTWPITVSNRLPVAVGTPAPFTVDHVYDQGLLAYRATAALSTWVDPDGDPVLVDPDGSTGDPQCAVVVGPGGQAWAECRLDFVGIPAVANFAGAHVVAQPVRDPFAPAIPVTASFTIGNRPPSITSTAPISVGDTCTVVGCCTFVPGEGCVENRVDVGPSQGFLSSRWADPDGDPLRVEVSSGSVVCTPPACAVPIHFDGVTGVCGGYSATWTTSVTDGAASTSAPLTVFSGC